MDTQIVVDPHYLSGEKEIWTLKFTHAMVEPRSFTYRPGEKPDTRARVHVSLEAWKGDDCIDVARMSFLPGERPERMMMETHPDSRDIIEAMVAQNMAKVTDERVERYRDYPGADEIEEFRYQKIDVTQFYNDYMHSHEKKYMDSPFSHIRQCEGEVMNGRDPKDYIQCRIGGIEQKRAWAGLDGRNFSRVVKHYPECMFHMHELAEKVYAKQMMLYREAQKRVTHYHSYEYKGIQYIRCKIDGEQQSAREVNRLDMCDYALDKDFYALAIKYYADELDSGIRNNRGLCR